MWIDNGLLYLLKPGAKGSCVMGYRTLVNEMQDDWRSQGAMTG